NRQADQRAADAARHAAKRGCARATRDRRIRDLEPGGSAVDEDHRRKPHALEKGARRTESARLSSSLPPLATRAPAIRRAIFLGHARADPGIHLPRKKFCEED